MFTQPSLRAVCHQRQTVEQTTFFRFLSHLRLTSILEMTCLLLIPSPFHFSYVLTFIGLNIVADGHSCSCKAPRFNVPEAPCHYISSSCVLGFGSFHSCDFYWSPGLGRTTTWAINFQCLVQDLKACLVWRLESHSVSSRSLPFHCNHHVVHTLNTAEFRTANLKNITYTPCF